MQLFVRLNHLHYHISGAHPITRGERFTVGPHICRYDESVILRRLPYGTPSFFRRLLSVEAFNLRISAAPPLPSIMPPVLSKTRSRYVRSSSSSGTKSFDGPANASREAGWALGPDRSTVKTSSSASNTALSITCSNSRILPGQP